MNNKENISAVTKHVFIKYMSIYDVSTCNYLTLTLRFYIFYYIGVFKKKEKNLDIIILLSITCSYNK